MTSVGAPRGVVLLILALCCGCTARLEELSVKKSADLQKAFFSGQCYAVACTDMKDKGLGAQLLEAAKIDKKQDHCVKAKLRCLDKLPASGSSTMKRLGLTLPREGLPLIFVAVNGEQRAVGLEDYSTETDDKMARSDPAKLASYLAKAALPPKPARISTDESFQKRCLDHRHCLLLLYNSSNGEQQVAAVAETVSQRYRTSRVVVADESLLNFSLSGALPPVTNGAPRAVYLRKLSKREQQSLASEASRMPSAKVSKSIAASLCSREKLASLREDPTAATALFEAGRLAPRGWPGIIRSSQQKKVVFRVDGFYLSYEAAAPLLMGQSLFGGALDPAQVESLAAQHPLLQLPTNSLKTAATAFKLADDDFSVDALDTWVQTFLSSSSMSILPADLKPLRKTPRMHLRKPASSTKRRPPSPRPTTTTPRDNSKKEQTKKKAPEKTASSAAERAKRESEVRRRMEAEAMESMPQAVETDALGDASWLQDDDDDDNSFNDNDDDDEDDDDDSFDEDDNDDDDDDEDVMEL